MKTMMTIQTVIMILSIIFLGCSKDDNANNENHQKDSIEMSLVDSLDGLWFWYATYHPKNGMIDNEFSASLRITYNTKDSSILFETYKNDTLLKSGSLNIYKTDFGLKIEPSIILFTTVSDEIYIKFLSKDTIKFYENCNDCPMYYFTNDNTDTSENIVYLPVFDSLQGTWNWCATYDAKKGFIDNEFQSKIKILSIDKDTLINYETFKNETLYKSGKLKITRTDWGNKIEPSIIPNFTVSDEIYFELLTNDSLRFYEKCNDCPFYYYTK